MIKELLRVSVLNNGRKLDFSKMSFFSLKILFFFKKSELDQREYSKNAFFLLRQFFEDFQNSGKLHFYKRKCSSRCTSVINRKQFQCTCYYVCNSLIDDRDFNVQKFNRSQLYKTNYNDIYHAII
jgi:hypothetical protein